MLSLRSVNFEIRSDITRDRLRTSPLQITIKFVCFAVIPYIAHMFYGYLHQTICNGTTSNLEAGQSVSAGVMTFWSP